MNEPLRVMLVEDEALILMQLEDMVEEAGHQVVGVATRRAEAIEVALRVRPDLAFVDINLCDGDSGLDVARAFRAIDRLHVVFVTANPMRLGDDLAGAAGVIPKPFSHTTFLRSLSFLEECIRNPPPISSPPNGMKISTHLIP